MRRCPATGYKHFQTYHHSATTSAYIYSQTAYRKAPYRNSPTTQAYQFSASNYPHANAAEATTNSYEVTATCEAFAHKDCGQEAVAYAPANTSTPNRHTQRNNSHTGFHQEALTGNANTHTQAAYSHKDTHACQNLHTDKNLHAHPNTYTYRSASPG